METEFIQYQQALELKELGFDEPCFYQYVRDFDNDGELIPITSETNCPILRNNNQVSLCSGGDCFAAPLYQQAFRWFRDKYNLLGSVDYSNRLKWYYVIREVITSNTFHNHSTSNKEDFNNYEEAELACLKKLIQILKEKL